MAERTVCTYWCDTWAMGILPCKDFEHLYIKSIKEIYRSRLLHVTVPHIHAPMIIFCR